MRRHRTILLLFGCLFAMPSLVEFVCGFGDISCPVSFAARSHCHDYSNKSRAAAAGAAASGTADWAEQAVYHERVYRKYTTAGSQYFFHPWGSKLFQYILFKFWLKNKYEGNWSDVLNFASCLMRGSRVFYVTASTTRTS